MRKTLAEIAEIVDGEVVGDPNLVISGLSGIKEACEGDLTFLSNPKYLNFLKDSKASAILTTRDVVVPGKTFIYTEDPSKSFTEIAEIFVNESAYKISGIHPSAIIAPSAKLGKDVSIGPNVVIDEKCEISDHVIINAGTFVGSSTSIGKNSIIHPNVTIYHQTSIGENVIIHSGTVIGSDGYGYIQIENYHKKIPQLGIVVIENNVEIGSNVTIDRARFDKTLIGEGTKIDNLVQIAHNVRIGKNCIIVALVGISGSVVIEDGVILAGQAGVAGHITIGEKAIITAKAGVLKNVPAKAVYSGHPARPQKEMLKAYAGLNKLPNLIRRIEELENKLKQLEEKK